jgi:hypothetical protein
MVRLFGRSSGRNRQQIGCKDIDDDRSKKLRLSPTAALDNSVKTPHDKHSVHQLPLSSPMYQYALDEYAQAVAPGTSNDDGLHALLSDKSESHSDGLAPPANPVMRLQSRSHIHEPGSQHQNHPSGSYVSIVSTKESEISLSSPNIVPSHDNLGNAERRQELVNGRLKIDSFRNNRSTFERDRPDVTYEEVYGPAYVGGTIKYIYPTGYQSMRPRSCPWKLSIVVCLLFTWLSVFIVGHCSDQADESAAAAAAASDGSPIDDDALVMEIRWCGSRLLYMMWAASMMVTGLSAAYCSVIGYIKVRDFAVANSRSQPPGIADGKSDYYVRIRDHQAHDYLVPGGSTIIRRSSIGTDDGSSIAYYEPTIYQSDGTPQYWGSHIYRPTQAAVAVTSR